MRKIFILISLFLTSITYSQNSFTDNYPFKIGNTFYLIRTFSVFFGGTTVSYHTTKIISDTTINGKRYYKLFNTPANSFTLNRLDTVTGVLFQFDPSNTCSYYGFEKPIDSLWASLNETPTGCGYSSLKCTDTSTQSLFGSNVSTKTFYKYQSVANGNIQITRKYAKGFGHIYYEYSSYGGGGGGYEKIALVGCVIDGIVFGDTNLTALSHSVQTIPVNYKLSQNYPNPFNPSTKIKFDIPEGSFVKLKVYDILGREVAELVNEKLNVGVYEYEWNGVGLPSGVYFYRLQAGEFVETRRMVLVK